MSKRNKSKPAPAPRPPLVPVQPLDAKAADGSATIAPAFVGLKQTSCERPWELPLLIQALIQGGDAVVGVLPYQFPGQPFTGYLITTREAPSKSTDKP